MHVGLDRRPTMSWRRSAIGPPHVNVDHHRARRAGERSSSSPTRSPRCARSSTPTDRASAPSAASTTDRVLTVAPRRGAQRQERAGGRDRPTPRRRRRDVRRHEPADRRSTTTSPSASPATAPSGRAWPTIEEPLDLAGARSALPATPLVIVDCLTLWVGNLLAPRTTTSPRPRCAAAAIAARQPTAPRRRS